MLESLKSRAETRRKAGEIYGAIVTQARQPSFYAELGVPDTPSGRYEMVVLHLSLVIERLRSEPVSPLPRMLAEAFVADMDDSLRELGTGDVTVPKKVRRAATGLYERSVAYNAALESSDKDALADALAQHVYGADNGRHANSLAAYVRAAAASLAATHVLEGSTGFPSVQGLDAEAR
jgi:cytochrome b pre-mRNA-processing protein 3